MSDTLRNILQFGVLPAAVVLVVYFAKRKLLWAAPFLSSGLFILMHWMLQPNIFTEPEWRGQLLFLVTPMHFCAAAAITFLASRVAKKKK